MSFDFTVKEFILGNGTGLGQPFQFYRKGFNIGYSGSGPSWQDIILSGNGSLSLTNAKAHGLNYLKLFGGTEQRNLPIGYTQYDYLRSSGTQYIDLGYKGKGNTKVEIKFKYHTATSSTGSGRVFGSRTTATSNAFAIGTSSGIVASTNNKIFWCYDGQPFYVDDTEFGLDEWKTVVFSATEHSIDGVSVGDDYTVTEFETPTTLKLFGFDQQNGAMGVGYVDIAYCKLWDNDGTLVRDVVPAYDGITYSMYDKVSGAMLPNAGTGTFEVGNAIVPTPDKPINIISNNGAIKYSANICNVNEQTALIGYYISSSGVVTADANNWIYQDFIPVKPNTTYTLTMSSSVYYVTISEYSTADDSGFVIRKAGISGDNTTLTITTESTTNFVRFGANLYRGEVTLETVLAINWMLNVGDTMAYQPYVEGGIYTDGTVETVEVTGQNLLDLANCIDGHYYSADGTYSDAESARLSNFVKVKANESYTVFAYGLKGSANVRVNLFDVNQTWLSQQVMASVLNQYIAITVTATQDGYLAFSANFATTGSCIDWTLSQIIKGSYTVEQMPEYKPYFSDTATAEMLLKVGNYQDVQSILDGVVTRNVGVKVLDGTEDWQLGSSSERPFYLSNSIIGGYALPNTPFCTHFQGVASTVASLDMPDLSIRCGYEGYYARSLYIKYKDLYSSGVNAFKNYLAQQYANGTPVTIVYPLAEPTTESVESQALTIQAGTNTIEITQASIDNLELEVSYKGTV